MEWRLVSSAEKGEETKLYCKNLGAKPNHLN